MQLLIGLALLVLILWAVDRYYLRGEHLDASPAAETIKVFTSAAPPGPEQREVTERVKDLEVQITAHVRKRQLHSARAVIDSISDNREYSSTFAPIKAGGVPAEWVLAPATDASRRVLYIHGGGFMIGSPKSHRTITSKLSEITGCAVLAIDYRLLPEHRLMDCVEDCRSAFKWILSNGPAGPGAVHQLFFAGDSAGGSLALSLAAWVRDNGLRAPDAVVALSPLTDNTFSGASIRSNENTDVMLAPILRIVNRLPQLLKNWLLFGANRMRPSNPIVSPLFGDLSGLPPTLVQASESEMLLDDARRYVCKAHASGSPIKLQIWPGMMHVWQIFTPELPQAVEAWSEIGKFLETKG